MHPRSPRWSSSHRKISTRRTGPLAKAGGYRPSLELLEDRRVPSAVSFLTAPIIPAIDPAMFAHLTAIHEAGLRLGNQDTTFSKVGDSITSSQNFLTELGSSAYDLGDPALLGNHAELAPTIAYYRSVAVDSTGNNSFDHASLAAAGGWMSQSLLTGFPGDSPLTRELAATRPAIALIMIGTNDAVAGTDPALFRFNLTLIVDTAASLGVIPVLSTIPDNLLLGGIFESRVLMLNQVITDVAAQLDVPLWNYWRAANSLPGEGVDAIGVHPSESPLGSGVFTETGLLSGYNMRNFTALEMLRELKTQVLHVPDDISIVLKDSAAHAHSAAAGAVSIQIAASQLAASAGSTSSVNAGPVQIVVGQLPAAGTALGQAAASVPQQAPQNVLEVVGSGSGRLGTTKDLTSDTATTLAPVEPKPTIKPELLPSPTPVEDFGPEINPIGLPAFDFMPDFQAPIVPVEPGLPALPLERPVHGLGQKLVAAGLLIGWAGRRERAVDEEEENEKRRLIPTALAGEAEPRRQ